MKFVSVRDLRLKPGEVWKLAREEKELVITSNGRPVAILTGADEDTFEEQLRAIQRARTLTALESVHAESLKKGTDRISEEEIEQETRAARRERGH